MLRHVIDAAADACVLCRSSLIPGDIVRAGMMVYQSGSLSLIFHRGWLQHR